MNAEEWKPIAGYEGWYEVSNHGRVRGCERIIYRRGQVAWHRKPAMMGYRNVLGRNYVTLSMRGVRRCLQVSQLVARAFIGNPTPERPLVAHLDGNPMNNRVSNLVYASHLENAAHMKEHGTCMTGERHWGARWTTEQVLEMKRLRKQGWRYHDIGKKFGVPRGRATLRSVVERNWKHLDHLI